MLALPVCWWLKIELKNLSSYPSRRKTGSMPVSPSLMEKGKEEGKQGEGKESGVKGLEREDKEEGRERKREKEGKPEKLLKTAICFQFWGSCTRPPSPVWAKFGMQVWAYGVLFHATFHHDWCILLGRLFDRVNLI